MVVGPEAQIIDSDFFHLMYQSESKSRMGEGRRRCRVTVLGRRWRGVHRGHFQVPGGMEIRGGRRQSTCHPALHMSQRSI